MLIFNQQTTRAYALGEHCIGCYYCQPDTISPVQGCALLAGFVLSISDAEKWLRNEQVALSIASMELSYTLSEKSLVYPARPPGM